MSYRSCYQICHPESDLAENFVISQTGIGQVRKFGAEIVPP